MLRGVKVVAAAALASAAFHPMATGAAHSEAVPIRAAQDELAAAQAAAEAIDTSGKPAEADAAWRKVIALQQARSKPDYAAIAIARNRIGDTLYYRGRPDLAQKELEGARDMLEAQKLGESDAMSETLANLGTMHTAQGRPQEDIAIQRRAMAIRVKLYGPDDPRLAINYYNTGYALSVAGFPAEAADNVERGTRMRLATMKPENADLFLSLGTAAGILQDAGRLNTAIEFAQRSVELVISHHPKHLYAGFVRGVLGNALVAAGRASEAAEVNRQAMDELAAAMGEKNPLTLSAMGNLAVSLGRLGRYEEAQVLMLRAIPEKRGGPPAEVVRSLLSASNFAAEAGREDQALAIAEDAHGFAHEKLPADHAMRAQIAAALAVHLERRGENARALALMRDAEAIYAKREGADSPRLLGTQVYLGGLEIAAGVREQGYARVTAAAEKLAPAMFGISEDPELGSANSSYYETFARAAEAAVQMDRPGDAFRYYQLAAYDLNSQASQQVALRNAAGRGGAAAARVRDLQDASRNLRALHVQKAALLASGKADRAAAVDASLAATEQSVLRLRAELAGEVPGFDRLSRPEIIRLETLQGRLASGEGLLIALPSRTRTTLMLVKRDQVRTASTNRPRSAMRPLVDAVRSSIDQGLQSGGETLPAFDLAASHALYQALFPGEIGKGLASIDKLHVAATDALARVPFALLVARKPGTGSDALRRAHWLIRDTSIDVPITIASIGGDTRARSAGGAFAGIGAPTLGGAPGAPIQLANLYRSGRADTGAIRDLPALPQALGELNQMRAALGGSGSVLLTGEGATEPALKAMDLSRFSVLAFATHGLIADEIDGLQEPALVLTPPAEAVGDNDGMLTASEIAALRLDADWVILSACNTAAGATRSAPSYTGLAHAFLYAGARSLLLSHWRVRDDAASRLSVATVRGTAAGLDRAEALRRAMLALIDDRKVRDGAHPAIWAPFILIGQ